MTDITKRNLLKLAAGISAAAFLPLSPSFASAHAPENISPDEALRRLKQGNTDFVAGKPTAPNREVERRRALAAGQAPYCAVVGCADSRVPPELLFNAGFGDLFVMRVAGNTCDADTLGSLEYGVTHLGIPLILVLGHERCGAVTAALDVAETGVRLPGSLEAVVDPILPAVMRAKKEKGDLLANAIRENVMGVVEGLKTSEATITEPLAKGRLKLAGAVYDLDTGVVDFLA